MCRELKAKCSKASMAKFKVEDLDGRIVGERWWVGRLREEGK